MTVTCNPKVLVVAPKYDSRGGIASVIQLHMRTTMWTTMSCRILSTFSDRGLAHKLLSALLGYLRAPYALWTTQLVHIHAAGETSLLRKLPILMMAKLLHRPVIIHLHASSEESLFQRTPAWAWRYGLGAADRVIALSTTWAETIRAHVPGAIVSVVPNPVRSFSPAQRACSSSPRILYVGKVETRKGYDTLLDAAAILHQEFPTAEFWFAGHGELDQASQHSRERGLSSVVRLLGWLSPEEMEAIYNQVDLFCLPSRNEGVPMAMLEAMSHALPVVVTAVGGIPDVVRDGENGLLVRPEDPVSLAEAISRVLREPALASTLAITGQRDVQSSCNLEVVGDQLASLYRRTLTTAHR